MEPLCWLIQGFLIMIVLRVILSFLPQDDGSILSSIGNVVVVVTEPVLGTVRRALPQPGDIPIDFSPAVVMFGLFFISQLLGC